MWLMSFYTPWKYQKTFGFLMFSRGLQREQWFEMDKWVKTLCLWIKIFYLIKIFYQYAPKQWIGKKKKSWKIPKISQDGERFTQFHILFEILRQTLNKEAHPNKTITLLNSTEREIFLPDHFIFTHNLTCTSVDSVEQQISSMRSEWI